jgi:phosphoribosylformimino-5-aminoimidazole carboxamide ribotide isomerase
VRSEPGPATATLYPAIDLRGGRCVRLEQGAAERETVYAADPFEVASSYHAQGARWLHVVDLDAAFGEGSNRSLIRELAEATPLRVQTGGGLRSMRDLEEVLESAVERAVVGTAAVEDPALVEDAVRRWGGGRVAVGLDARGNRPATRGWRDESGADLFDLGASLAARGVETLIYTDIERDGMLAGPNLATSAALAERTGAAVVVSGGVATLEDLAAVAALAREGAGVRGVIVGKALYEGRFGVPAALRALGG